MKLVIGKNSKIVKSLQLDQSYQVISHQDIDSCNFSEFSQIFLFSHNDNQNKYLELLKKIPIDKTIFISTTSVFSNLFRPQPFKYPTSKLVFERYILSHDGKICRLGIFDDSWVPSGLRYPKTSLIDLKRFMQKSSHETIINLFKVARKKGKIHTTILDFFEDINFLYFVSAALKKILGYKLYGYNRDTLKAFNGVWLVGNGALGNMCYGNYGSKIDHVVSSDAKNIVIKDHGFKDTYIGKTKYGLGDLWHGVRIKKKDGKFYKDVPFFMKRKKISSKKIVTKKIDSVNTSKDDSIKLGFGQLQSFPEKVILAAGPIENLRILSSNSVSTWSGSDHEVYFYGQCLTSEVLKKGYMKRFGPFLFRDQVLTNKYDLLIDFRPGYKNLKKALDSGSFFTNNNKFAIVLKVLSKFDFERMNEAFFNKFGFSFYTKKTSIFFQRVFRNCISIDIQNNNITKMKRKRLSSDQLDDHMGLLKNFESLEKNKNLSSIDSQHIVFNDKFKYDHDRLYILGSPSKYYELDAFHHTRDLYDKNKKNIKEFLTNK